MGGVDRARVREILDQGFEFKAVPVRPELDDLVGGELVDLVLKHPQLLVELDVRLEEIDRGRLEVELLLPEDQQTAHGAADGQDQE